MGVCFLRGGAGQRRKLPLPRLEGWAVERSRRIEARRCWPTGGL